MLYLAQNKNAIRMFCTTQVHLFNKVNHIIKLSQTLIWFMVVNLSIAQNKNFHTSIGLGICNSMHLGDLVSNKPYNLNSGFASNNNIGAKFILEQNLGKRFGFAMNFYSVYPDLDVSSLEKSLQLNNRGLSTLQGVTYEIEATDPEWEVSVANLGVYYYKYIGEKNNFLLKFMGSFVITEMVSPKFTVNVKDPSNNTVEVRTIKSAHTYRETFFLAPPVDGFSLETSAQYFFTRHFAVNPSVCFVNSIAWFKGKDKALINLSEIHYQAFYATLGITYTFFYGKGSK